MTDTARTGLFTAAIFAGGAWASAYLPLWFADRGLSAGEIGQVLGIGALLRVVLVPVWGWAADAVGRAGPVLCTAAVLAAVSAGLLATTQGSSAPGFWVILVLSAIQGVAASALSPLADTLTLALAAARRLQYGPTRAYGSVAYMGATAGGGLLLDRTGSWVVPWLLVAGYGVAASIALVLPRIAAPPPPGGPDVGLWQSRPFRLALIGTALIQGSHAAYYAFAPLHWRAAGISDGVIGLLIAEGVVAEVALFIWGRRVVERLGPARLTAIAAAAAVVRWSSLAFITAVPGLVLLQPLHALTFAFQHLSAMLVLHTLPPGRAGRAQATLSALGFSGATGVLIAVSGQAYGEAGGLTFLLMAAVGGCGLFVAAAMRR